MPDLDVQQTLSLAAQVDTELREQGCETLLIGAVALAAHGYARNTEDIDLAVAVPPRRLAVLAEILRTEGRRVELSEADGQDPLGGVITIDASGALPVQIVNFDNSPAGGFPALVRDSWTRGSPPPEGLCGRLPQPEDLILFKLYAGGPKSELDILELLTRCRVDLALVSERAHGYGLSRELAQLLERLA